MLKKDIDPEFLKSLCEDNEKAMQFLADVKWENGFVCRNCGHTNYCSGKSYASRRCTKCKKEESATANTIFHNCKFPINKAFYIIYTVCFEKTRISANTLSNKLSINLMTCWKFRNKFRECLKEHESNDEGDLDVKEIIIHEVKRITG
ncbi:MAG: hypothetical protein H6Q18_208 [Bacteroidetes bacterium]|nr:hypothetical protein [Bacteroidota bacterium]